ncbi:hypothetical protein SAMN05414137_11099 [Streptacidiphilus jiangxiensis]|uniref:Uncharacterized protein n=2 Tax=Streptacidiphilus jiangxiensis TaxID=235985 RepID=A0A1H7REX2_STRJI|nr:hypothetical protein SAMN05414137_11099 [Streptacidiphilus jiangxiensis]
MFQALAAEAVRRGHRVIERPVSDYHRSRPYYYNGRHHPSSYSRREGEIDIVIDSFGYTVTIQQESPQSSDPTKAARLVIEVPRYRATRQCAWRDRQRWTVEELLPVVLAELELRAVEDQQRAIDEERAKAERQVRWEAAMTAANEQAIHEQYAERLREQAQQWRQAEGLRAYCSALEARLSQPQAGDDASAMESARQWLAWARAHVLALDPLQGLPTMPEARKVKPEDLKPFLGEWSPHGPEGNRYGWE